jgi:dTDP-4-amino-4,6-dideoxygalactose transaminase
MIPLFKVHMPDEVGAPLMETLFSGYVGEGPRVKEFEGALARFLQSPNVLATNSCTSAIQLALRLANVGAGDEVITTPMTWSRGRSRPTRSRASLSAALRRPRRSTTRLALPPRPSIWPRP